MKMQRLAKGGDGSTVVPTVQVFVFYLIFKTHHICLTLIDCSARSHIASHQFRKMCPFRCSIVPTSETLSAVRHIIPEPVGKQNLKKGVSMHTRASGYSNGIFIFF